MRNSTLRKLKDQLTTKSLCLAGMFTAAHFFVGCAQAPSAQPAPMVEVPYLGEGAGSDAGNIVTAGNRSAFISPAPPAKAKSVKQERTGIATGWGREVTSDMNYTEFKRGSSKPVGTAKIRYNDQEGAKEMGVYTGSKSSKMQRAAGGLIEWGITGGWRGFDHHWWRGDRFVIGQKGREYSISVKNLSNRRIEVVLSVDGLDVMDGKQASIKKRGYIIQPRKTLTVKGFRSGYNKVARFKFSSVSGSYSNLRHGQTRNVGVIGLAAFTEKGGSPYYEASQRGSASPFAEAPSVRARN